MGRLRPMANHKPPRADAEVQALATRWRSEWTPHDGIEPWLRRHMAELTGLIHHDRWSWADLTRALNDAGIFYGTGRPWSATRLSSKVRTLRMRQRLSSPRVTPQDLMAAVREALGATVGNFNTININLIGGVASSSDPAAAPLRHPPTHRAPLPAPVITPAPTSPPEPKFRPARLRNDGRGVSVEERRALGDPTVPADPRDPQ